MCRHCIFTILKAVNFFFWRFYSSPWLWRRLLNIQKHAILPDFSSLSDDRHEVPCPLSTWLPNISLQSLELRSYSLRAPKSVVAVISLYQVKALGVPVSAQEWRGEVKFTGLPCQQEKGKHFSVQIINPGLNHRFKPYLEVRSYKDTGGDKNHMLAQRAKGGLCQTPQPREGSNNLLISPWPRQSYPIATFSPGADFNELEGERVAASF